VQAQAFAALPFAEDAVRVRRWDDGAKSADAVVPGLSHFVRHMKLCAGVRPAAQPA